MAQTFQSVVTGLGIIAGGVWALYVFVLGRSFAGNVRIWFELKYIADLTEGNVAVVTVKARNIGRTQVLMKKKEDKVTIYCFPLAFDSSNLRSLRIVPTSLDFSQAKSNRVFANVQGLEPDEEIATDVPLTFGPNSTLIVYLEFTGTVRRLFFGHINRRWNSLGILDVRMDVREELGGKS